jgi:hypothetical protein
MTYSNDLLLRARRCRKTADSMREQADRHEAGHDAENAIRRRRSAANLEALATELERQATQAVVSARRPHLWRTAGA